MTIDDAYAIIVGLQHKVRELEDEIGNLTSPLTLSLDDARLLRQPGYRRGDDGGILYSAAWL